MESEEEAFTVTWEQLPQHEMWIESGPKPIKLNEVERTTNMAHTEDPYPATVPAGKQAGGWEYLDHTADVQIHSWGCNMGEAFGAVVVGMFAYMVELDEIGNELEMHLCVNGHDLETLLYAFMDECLYVFHTGQFVVKEAILKELDTSSWTMGFIVRGGLFDAERHSKGTEVKAITYSNMQIIKGGKDKVETYVIVDI